MGTSKAYDDLVEGFRKKISGNVSSEKMTESECEAEIAAVTEGAFEETRKEEYHRIKEAGFSAIDLDVMPAKKKRGRPRGSKNRPKVK